MWPLLVTLVQLGPSYAGQTLLRVWGFPKSISHPEKRKQWLLHTLPHGCWLGVRGTQGCREGLRVNTGISQVPGPGKDSERRRDGVLASLYTEPASPRHTRCSMGQCKVEVNEIRPLYPRGHQLAGQRHTTDAPSAELNRP